MAKSGPLAIRDDLSDRDEDLPANGGGASKRETLADLGNSSFLGMLPLPSGMPNVIRF